MQAKKPHVDIDLDFDEDTYRCFETAISNLNIELQKAQQELVKRKKKEEELLQKIEKLKSKNDFRKKEIKTL